jgi:hypothetical protein
LLHFRHTPQPLKAYCQSPYGEIPVSLLRLLINFLQQNVNIPHLGPFDQSKPFPVTSSTRRGYRKEKKVYAQNQNYYEEEDFPQLSSPINDQNSSKVDQILRSFINKHLQRVYADKIDFFSS